MIPLALRTRLTLSYTGILALLVGALSLAYYRVLAVQLDHDASEDLAEITSGLHGYLHVEGGTPHLAFDSDDAEQVAFIGAATRYYQIYDVASGQLLVQSPALEPLGLRYTPSEVLAFRQHPSVEDVQTDQGRLRLSNTVIASSDEGAYLLQVGISLSSVDAALDRYLMMLLWSVPVGLLIAAVTGRWLAGRALAPLTSLAGATRAISVSNLHQRLPIRGAGDELDEVAQAFNETLANLEHKVDEMRQFSAALAHELRTPLAALRGEVELALLRDKPAHEQRRALVNQLEGLDKLARLVSQLLTLARAEAGQIPLARDVVDLVELATSVTEQLEAVAQVRGVSLSSRVTPPVAIVGDAGWIERLLLNLLDNAIKFTPSGGRILVEVTAERGYGRLDVIDTGMGIEASELPHLFERFYRADASRSPEAEGSGLGLTLAKWIADRHDAAIVVSSRVGEGTTFTVRFPQAGSRRS